MDLLPLESYGLVVKIISDEYDDVFSQQSFDEHVTFSTLKNKLQLFHRWHNNPSKCDNLFKWWVGYECQFPNMALLAQQVLGIVGSQIETKWIFCINEDVITTLHWFWLESKNL
jgi:hypothetical protein